jgi:hypothetical protein
LVERQHLGQQQLIINHNEGKRHEQHGTRPPIFEERIRRPNGAKGTKSVTGEETQRSPRNGAPEDGVYDSWNMIEAVFSPALVIAF